jgi:hypothetical protein
MEKRKIFPCRESNLGCSARRQSLYRLNYPWSEVIPELNQSPYGEDVGGSGGIVPTFLTSVLDGDE